MNTSALLTSDAKDNVESGCRLNQITLQFHLKKNISLIFGSSVQ